MRHPNIDELRPGPGADHAAVAPRDLTESLLVDIWESVLGKTPVGITSTFSELGGTSPAASLMVERVEEACGVPVPRSTSWQSLTIKALSAQLCEANRARLMAPYRRLVAGEGRPFFFLHGDFISGGLYCRNLARAVGGGRPFYALPPYPEGSPILDSVEAMATVHLDTVRRLQAEGPYLLGGFCAGALVAFEIARRLHAQGERVERLVLIAPRPWSHPLLRRRLSMGIGRLLGLAPEAELTAFIRLVDKADRRNWARHKKNAPHSGSRGTRTPPARGAPTAEDSRRGQLWKAYHRANCTYVLRKYAGDLTIVWPEGEMHRFGYPDGPWRRVARHVDLHRVPGEHLTSVTRHVAPIAQCVRACLETIAGAGAECPDAPSR